MINALLSNMKPTGIQFCFRMQPSISIGKGIKMTELAGMCKKF